MAMVVLSFESAERAQEFLAEQIPAFDYDAVKEAAKSAWRDTLGVIELKTTDKALAGCECRIDYL